MLDPQYAYLFANAVFLLVWVLLFLFRKDLQTEMLVMSLSVAPFGLTQVVFLQDYWQPQYVGSTFLGGVGLEDFAFTFLFGGIAAVLYEEIFGKRHAKRHIEKHPHWMLGFIVAATVLFFIGTLVFGLNSIYVSSVLLLIIGMTVILLRHDLIRDAFLSGTLLGSMFFLFYLLIFNNVFPGMFEQFWLVENLSGITIAGVLIEEVLWAFSFGFAAGPSYEFIRGITNKIRA